MPLSTTLRAAALALACAMPIACGGPPPPPATPVAITGEAPPMPVVLVVKAANPEAEPLLPAVQSSLTTAFATAGWTIVEKADEAAVKAQVLVSATEQPSMMTTMVNGVRQVTYDVKVDGLFNDMADSKLIDKGTVSFESDNGTVDETSVANLVAIVTNRGKLVAHADAVAQAADAEEDKLWEAANVEDCSKATSEDACSGVETYLEKYEAGRYAAEGRKAIEDGKAAATAKTDEEDWAKADADTCKKPKAVEDCAGVQKYLDAHPTGAHAEEGKEVLSGVAKQLELLAKKAEAAAKRNRKQDCVKSCRRRYRRYAPGSFQILVNRCIHDDCS